MSLCCEKSCDESEEGNRWGDEGSKVGVSLRGCENQKVEDSGSETGGQRSEFSLGVFAKTEDSRMVDGETEVYRDSKSRCKVFSVLRDRKEEVVRRRVENRGFRQGCVSV